jgi:hypothetical protein
MRPLKLWKVWQTLRLLEAEAEAETILLPLNQPAVAVTGMQAMAMQAMAAMMAGMEEDMVAVTVDTGKPHLFAVLLLSRLGYRLLLPTHFPVGLLRPVRHGRYLLPA